jgi:hypothetical protein
LRALATCGIRAFHKVAAMSVFDGMADIFTDPGVFGEAVDYKPLATGTPQRITAIWWELQQPEIMVGMVESDGNTTQLSVRAADVAAPAEGDIATRISDGKVMTVSTPINPDGKGIIVCNLT